MLLPVLAVSCGQNKGTGNGDEMLEYSPQVNEVEVIRLEETDFQWQLLANGKLTASTKSQLYFRTTGIITHMNIINGQRVNSGQILAELDQTDLALALDAARISFRQTELELFDFLAGQGYQSRDTSDISREIMTVARIRSGYDSAKNSLKKAEHDFDGTVLKAPFSGVTANIAYRKYDSAGAEALCTLIDDSIFNVDFMILESEYPNVSVGMNIRVIPFGSYFGEGEITGKIVSVNPVVDKNGQILVRAEVINNGTCVEGMNVKVLVEKAIPDQFVVPKSAVVIRDNMPVLFKYEQGRARWTYVNTLMSNSENYAIKANTDRGATLIAGDTVIVSGNLNIADGSEVILKSE